MKTLISQIRSQIKGQSWKTLAGRFGLGLSFAVIIATSICQFELASVEAWFYDMRVRTTPSTAASGHIQLVKIKPSDIEILRGEPKMSDHIALLKNLLHAKPNAVLYMYNMSTAEGTQEQREEFVALTKKFNKFYLTTDRFIIKGQEDQLKLPPPLDQVPTVMAMLTKDDDNFAKDQVTRRILLSNNGQPFIHHELAIDFNKIDDPLTYKGAFPFLTSYQALIDYRPTGTYPGTSFTEAMFNPEAEKTFNNKIVLIGIDTIIDAVDYRQTPFSREITAMSGLEVHANMLDTLILNSAPSKSPRWLDLVLTILISILTVFAVLMLRPSTGLIVICMTLSAFFISSYGLFAGPSLILDMTHPLLAVFICYYFFIPYRLIMENRKSWEYLQHNKLLTQVEELKTNFLRMMSHDLKTPLARIQGMTDVALRDTTPLSPIQKAALNSIRTSSSELTLFIDSVLNLSRIESNEVKLQLHSKDVNAVMSEVVEKCRFLAKDKNIEIIEDYEPLFSNRIDEGLLKQVFTNLVENAIKYSPENSKIMVSTEEASGQLVIQVADQGQGIPLEDQPKIFEKFYRAGSVQHSSIKGHGLGLYLTKYFVELHNGQISLDSEVGKGSTFTVNLPTEL